MAHGTKGPEDRRTGGGEDRRTGGAKDLATEGAEELQDVITIFINIFIDTYLIIF